MRIIKRLYWDTLFQNEMNKKNKKVEKIKKKLAGKLEWAYEYFFLLRSTLSKDQINFKSTIYEYNNNNIMYFIWF